MATPEDHFQHEIIQRFSDEFPHLYGCLFEVNNDCQGGIKKIMHRTAMGMIVGAADLVLFANGIFTGIECKAEGMKHSKDRIEKQKNWGKIIVSQGGNYIMSKNEDEIFEFIKHALSGETGMFKTCY